jgi:hypothetical protein
VGKGLVIAAVAGVVAAVAPVGVASAAPGSHGVLTLAVYGDSPYGTSPIDTAQFQATPAFIDSINADPQVGLVAHVGDVHSGKQYCTDAYDRSVAGLWTSFLHPLVYTPGDNEWTDCHKVGEGGGSYDPSTQQIDYVLDPVSGQPADYAGGDPVANLALLRSIFFGDPGRTLGGGTMRVLSQGSELAPAHPADAKYVENVMFERKDVLFVTLNIPGGSNNDGDVWYGAPSMTTAQTQEAAERTGADLRWLDRAFAQATVEGDRAVLILTQADMWDLDGKTPAHLTGYEPFVASIVGHSTRFGKPVLLINGDSHVYRSDNPLSATAPCTAEVAGGGEGPCESEAYVHPGYDVPNFHRIVVHGSTIPLEWLKLAVDPEADNPAGPNAFGPFSWRRITTLFGGFRTVEVEHVGGRGELAAAGRCPAG